MQSLGGPPIFMGFNAAIEIDHIQGSGRSVRVTYIGEVGMRVNRLDRQNPIVIQPVIIEIAPKGFSFDHPSAVRVEGQGLEETFEKVLGTLTEAPIRLES